MGIDDRKVVGLRRQGSEKETRHVPRMPRVLASHMVMTALRDEGRPFGSSLQQFFTESLILAQDERWRRA
jgi:hypothetical protein